MLRVHLMLQWFALSDSVMEEVLHDVPLFRAHAQLSWNERLPDGITCLRFRHLRDKHKLAEQITETSSTKNSPDERDAAMHQTKKGSPWYFGMTSPSGEEQRAALVREADGAARLLPTVRGTSVNVNDLTEGHSLLHRDENDAFADAGF